MKNLFSPYNIKDIYLHNRDIIKNTFLLSFLFFTILLIIINIHIPTNYKQHASSPTIRSTSSLTSLVGLHVQGNKLVNNSGNTIILRGVDRSGTEYGCLGTAFSDGPTDLASIQAIASWGSNVIRVPLNEDCWLGINGATIGGATYQQDVLNYVNLITSQGMAVILDLHWNAPGTYKSGGQEPMADQDHAPSFWQGVATTFKRNGLVLFDLYNEPDPIPYSSTFPGGFSAWQTADFACVLNGCQATATQGVTYQTAGMQELLNTVRSTGATNVVMIGGIQDAGTITQYLGNSTTSTTGYMPKDSLNNVAVSQHLYNHAACSSLSCWTNTIAPVALHYPIITGEMGDTDCTSTYSSTLLPWLDSEGISYLAWTWDTWNSCEALITNYSGTPTSQYGQYYQNYLASLVGITATPIPTTIPTVVPSTPTPTLGVVVGLPDTTMNIHLGLIFNSQIPVVNGARPGEAPADYTWGASDNGVIGIPGAAAWHEKYTPWQRENDNNSLSWFQTNHPDWIMYGPDKTTPAGYGYNTYTDFTNVVLDYSNPAVQSWVAGLLINWLGVGYQGISFDNGVVDNNTNATGHYTLNHTWVAQYSGTEPNDSAFTTASTTAFANIVTLIKAKYPNASITVNTPYNSSWDTQSVWESDLDSLSMTLDEGELWQWDTSGSNQWLAAMNEYKHTQKDLGKGLVIVNLPSYTVTTDLTSTNTQARLDVQWALANYLLIKYVHTYFYFMSEGQYGDAIAMQPEYNAQIGTPRDDFYLSQNVYMRDYSDGLTIVNPNSSSSYMVTFPTGKYMDLYGNHINSYTMQPHTGLVLLLVNGIQTTPTITSTPTPLVTPAPTSTPTPAITRLSLTLGLDGIGKAGDNVNRGSTGNTNPLHPTRTVKLNLSDQNNNPLPQVTGTVTYDSTSGLFKGTVPLPSSVTIGYYTLRVASPSFLKKALIAIISISQGQTTTVPTMYLTAGDINNDDQISLLDYNLLLGCFGSSASACTPADLDDNGTVDGVDYNLFLRELSVQNGG